MAVLFRYRRVNGVSDDAVKAKTGKKWDEWFKVLDKAGARMMDHRPKRAQVIHSADVFVDAAGLLYCTDYNAGLYIIEFGG